MKPCILRTLSSKMPARMWAPPVAPWPPVKSTFDRWLAAELEDLQSCQNWHQSCTSAVWLQRALDVAVAAQAKAVQAIGVSLVGHDQKAVDDYLNDGVDLLDACNGLREMLWGIISYVNSLEISLRCLDGDHEPSQFSLIRSQTKLEPYDSTATHRRPELEKCSSNLRKLVEKLELKINNTNNANAEPAIVEALMGSRAVALFIVGALDVAFASKARRGLSPAQQAKSYAFISWTHSLHELHKGVKEEFDKKRKVGVALDELSHLVSAAAALRRLASVAGNNEEVAIRRELKRGVVEVRTRCQELEEKVRLFQKGIDELYTQLIAVRMALLGLISGLWS